MKYNFLNKEGRIISTDKLSTIKKGLTWEKLNGLVPLWAFKKEEKEFFKKYGFYSSIWNVACFQQLGLIYLFSKDIERLKGGKNDK